MSRWPVLRRSARLRVTLALTAVTAIALGPVASASGAPLHTVLRRADAPKVAVPATNVQVTQDASLISAEDTPSLAQDPRHRSNLVMVDRVDRPGYSAGVRYSTDSGSTWHPSALQPPPESAYQGPLALVPHKLYAPKAVFDNQGSLYVSFVTLSGSGNQPDGLWIERSSDGGQSFRPPTAIAGPHTFQADLVVDGHTGRLFSAWLQTPEFLCVLCFPGTSYPIVVSHSDDAGATWSTPLSVSDPGRMRVGSPVLAVDPNGNPAIVYYDYQTDNLDWENLPGTYQGNFSLVLATSTDRGASFGSGRVVDGAVVAPHRFLVYLAPTPAFAIGGNGEMVVAWADGRAGNAQVLLRSSNDHGSSWAGPVVVNANAADGQAQDLPAVGIASDGRVDVLYYDASGPTANVFLSSSADGGATFPTVTQVSNQSHDLQVGPEGSPFFAQADFGSRLALLSTDGRALAAWTDSRKGDAGTGRQDVYLADLAVRAPAGAGGLIIGLAAGAGALAVAGIVLLVLGRRRSRESGDRRGPPPSGVSEMPPPPPPLVPSPGQV